MKLISCHIENFGRLTDFTYYFEDGLSVLLAENGWGKSTLAAFLKVMFYGFEGENRRNEEGNERLRYAPWGGGIYGGSLIFAAAGKTYRMHRTFGSRKKEDSFYLFDDATGLSSRDFTEETGEELFGIDRESFCRTVFWSQRDHETEATTLIQAKIGDLAQEEDDLPSYDSAIRRLRRETERLSPDRASGQIRRKEEQASVLEADAAQLPLLQQQLKEAEARAAELDAELDAVRARRRAFTVAALAESSALRESPSQTSGERAAAEKLRILKKQLCESQKKLEALQKKSHDAAAAGHREREQYLRIRKEIRRQEEASSLASDKRQRSLLYLGGAFFIASAALFSLSASGVLPPPLLLLSALLLAAGIAVFYKRSRSGDLPDSPALASLREEEEALLSSLRMRKTRLHRAALAAGEEKKTVLLLEKKIRECRGEASRNVPSGGSSLPSGDLPVRELEGKLAPGLSEFESREEACRAQKQEVLSREEALRSRISDCQSAAARLQELRGEIRTLRGNYHICVQTAEYLEKARAQFISRYRNPFLRSFRRYYSMLTGESSESISADADFGVTIMDGGLPRDPALMSEGMRDLIGFCRRMAMIDAMYPGEKPFLVLDDPFSNLDDERVKGGLRFLQSASLEYQILYLTCHKSRI